ncbi:D-alanine aminotransferase (EC [Olavius algarvensis associated proteobacterium Delta 3]|nr:D-alanine aminotransferase (EC [Olavius algarvensis associated proteobacterium Delta 3]CAB5142645.1 D-alanine aminotransferase (EC [Olavius algarvensis associated proteobacterium Delta 3]
MQELAYMNGTIMPIDEAKVPIEDRGYNFGDAVYEYIASYQGKLVYLEEHLDRLDRSMTALSFPKMSRDMIRRAILELFEQSGIQRAGIYLQISRGVAPRDHAYPDDPQPQFMMTVRPVHEKPPEFRHNGATAITLTDLRWGRCDIKTVQLLANAMAKQQALEAGVFDAIFVSESGIVREATSSNVIIANDGRLITHPLTEQILPGITRQVILDICAERDLPAEERFFDVDTLYAADEVFLTGTVTEVLPIVAIDGRTIGDGKVGQMARKLSRALLESVGA